MKILMIKLKARFWEKILLFMMMIRYILLKSLLKTSKPISSVEISKSSTILATPLEPDVFENILKEPIINLSQTPPPPPPILTSVLIESTIPPLLKSISEKKNLHLKLLGLFRFRSSPILPHLLQYHKHLLSKIRHQRFLLLNLIEPPSTSEPPLSPSSDEDFIMGDEYESLEGFDGF
ncbi:unnamed protein product [Lactuca saligna]|uniref:Uncharacterized protein n=1 Tax=Lactuca saligna TaxID=75948 RepID=A0AA35VWK5_LACSI|nr:unnamed protein product [Lactuca saligna]